MATISPADQLEIHQLLAWYGHVVDWANWDRLSEVFTEAAVFEVRVPGSVGIHRGIDEIREAYASPGPAGGEGAGPHHRPGHHCSNIVITEVDGHVRVLSKYFGPTQSGMMFNGEYEDEVVRTPQGWRITSRVVIPRRDAGLDP